MKLTRVDFYSGDCNCSLLLDRGCNHVFPLAEEEGAYVKFDDVQIAIDGAFAQYEKQLEAAVKTGLLMDSEISTIQIMIRNLKDVFKVESDI